MYVYGYWGWENGEMNSCEIENDEMMEQHRVADMNNTR